MSEPWIGDATEEGESGCGFNAGALGDGPRCGGPVVMHILSESAMYGLVTVSPCAEHLAIARAAGVWMDEHGYGPGCEGEETLWTGPVCVPVPPGNEP